MSPTTFQSDVTAWVGAIAGALTVLIGAGFTIYSLIRSKLADIEARQNLHAQQIGAIALATPAPSQSALTVNESPPLIQTTQAEIDQRNAVEAKLQAVILASKTGGGTPDGSAL
jgi:hypothetical protein